MEECFKCGVSENKGKLHDAISEKGLVKICSKCSLDGDVPVIKRKDVSLEDAEKIASSGRLIKEREKAFEQMRVGKKSPVMSKQDINLRDLVDKNYKSNVDTEKKSWPGVIRNFNWILLRARRNKGFGQKQLAEMIGEPEIAIRFAERGTLPKEYVPFIRKLEKILEVSLMEENPFRLEEHKKMLNFKTPHSSEVTVGEFKNMARKKEIEVIGIPEEDFEKENVEISKFEKEKSEGFFKRLFSKKKSNSEKESEESQAL